jgi:hypothetical protein
MYSLDTQRDTRNKQLARKQAQQMLDYLRWGEDLHFASVDMRDALRVLCSSTCLYGWRVCATKGL